MPGRHSLPLLCGQFTGNNICPIILQESYEKMANQKVSSSCYPGFRSFPSYEQLLYRLNFFLTVDNVPILREGTLVPSFLYTIKPVYLLCVKQVLRVSRKFICCCFFPLNLWAQEDSAHHSWVSCATITAT